MLKITYRMFRLFSLITIIAACNFSVSSKEAAFARLVPGIEMNTKIHFWDLKPSEKFKIGDSVDLSLENDSQEIIKFNEDDGLRILVFNKNEQAWIEVENGSVYIPIPTPGYRQVSPKGPDVPGVVGVGLWPILENEGKPIDIRVVLIGYVFKDNAITDEQVGAYIDLTLLP